MTKKDNPTRKPAPLDRDGDGKDGGSLPGNRTATELKPDALDGADDATRNAIEGQNRPVSDEHRHEPSAEEAAAAVEALADWTRDDELILMALDEAGFDLGEDAAALATVASWADDRAKAVEDFLGELAASTYVDGENRRADGSVIDLPPELAEAGLTREAAGGEPSTEDTPTTETPPTAWQVLVIVNGREAEAAPLTFGVETNIPGLVVEEETLAAAEATAQDLARELLKEAGFEPTAFAFSVSDAAVTAEADREARAAEADKAQEPDPARPTFTEEEIRAGQTAVVGAEGEEVALAADAAPALGEGEDLLMLDTPAAQVAIRRPNLQRLVDNRFMYRSEQGYSPSYSPPYVDQAEVDVWIRHGLAEDSPSAGRLGGVKVTAEARSLLRRQPEAA